MGSGSPPAGASGRVTWIAAALLVLGTALRLADVWVHPVAPDEAYTMRYATAPWSEMVRLTAADVHPPFYYALLKVWFSVVGASLVQAKLVSVGFSVGTLWLTWHLASRWFGRRAGLLALASAALSPYLVYWSHSARNHLLLPLFVTAIIVLSCRYLEREQRTEWALLAVCWALALQTNYMGLVFAAVWVVIVLGLLDGRWPARLRLLASSVPGVLLFLPWVPVILGQARDNPMKGAMIQEHMSPASLYYHAIFGHMSHRQPTWPPLYLLTLVVFAFVCLAGARVVGRRWHIWAYLVGLPLVPMVIVYVLDLSLAERHLHFCLPVFVSYWGACLDRIFERVRQWRLDRRAGSDRVAGSQ
jgi:4-amino-4-deoxy-L-arabinose transferase-like glycosyltransferase